MGCAATRREVVGCLLSLITVALASVFCVSARADQHMPAIYGAQLFSGVHGVALNLLLNTPAFDPDVTAQVMPAEDGILYRYDSPPDNERLYFEHADSGDQSYVQIATASVDYSSDGSLLGITLPSDLPRSQKQALKTSLEQSLQTLSNTSPNSFAGSGHDNYGLMIITPSKFEFTLYSDKAPIAPLGSVSVLEDGTEQVHSIDETGLFERTLRHDNAWPYSSGKHLKVILVSLSHTADIAQKVADFVYEVKNAVGYDRIRPALLNLGMQGDTLWKHAQEAVTENTPAPSSSPDIRTPEVRQVDVKIHVPGIKQPLTLNAGRESPVVDLSHISDMSTGHKAICHIINFLQSERLEEFGYSPTDALGLQYIAHDHIAYSLSQDYKNIHPMDFSDPQFYALYSSSLRIYPRSRSDGLLKKTPAFTTAPPNSSGQNHFRNSLKSATRSFMSSAAIGSGIQAGIHTYDHYQRHGTLPHQYEWEEWKTLLLKSYLAAERHGFSGLATHLLTKAKVPTLIAGAAVGIANGLYDSYYNGDLTQSGYAKVIANAGAIPVVASFGAHLGRTAASATLPLVGQAPPTQLAASIAGSMVGQLVYQYVASTLVPMK